MIAGSVARRYAKALLELGIETQSQEAVGIEVEYLAHAFRASPELREAVMNPVFPVSERRATLEALGARLGLTRLVHNFVMLLLERGRIGALPDIQREYARLLDEHAGRIRARVLAPAPVPEELQQRLRAVLEQKLGKQVVLETRVDPSLIGGLVTEVGDLVYDGSIKYQMEALKEQLLSE
jgi:F-type H+-transporting ATPase subunit delta